MGVRRIGSVVAALLLAGGVCAVVPQAAFADGMADCTAAGTGYGMAAPDAGYACSLSAGGDNSDCVNGMRDAAGSTATYGPATDACAEAAPPPPAPAS